MSDTGAKKKKKKRCKRKKRCGKDCCNGSSCFAKRINEDNSTEVLEYGCCPAKSICKSLQENFPDQCCYEDEVCDPQLVVTTPELGTVCCRPCQGSCLRSDQECVNDVITELGTARLPRYRR
jgi:hypothetical protein